MSNDNFCIFIFGEKMKVPQHDIKSSVLKAVAAEDLEEEVKKEIETAKASQEDAPNIQDLLTFDNEDSEELQ